MSASAGVKNFLVHEAVPERSTRQFTVGLQTAAGALINPGDVSAVSLTLRDLASGAIVNGRDHQNVKDQNGGSVTLGEVAFQLTSDDTVILGDGNQERRLLTLDVQLANGGRGTREIYFYVRSFRDVA